MIAIIIIIIIIMIIIMILIMILILILIILSILIILIIIRGQPDVLGARMKLIQTNRNDNHYTRSPLQDSRLFEPSPWKVLALIV